MPRAAFVDRVKVEKYARFGASVSRPRTRAQTPGQSATSVGVFRKTIGGRARLEQRRDESERVRRARPYSHVAG